MVGIFLWLIMEVCLESSGVPEAVREAWLAGMALTSDGFALQTRRLPSHGPSLGPETVDGPRESARFLDFEGSQVYTVTHGAQGSRRGAVLLCGPLGVERERAYPTLVRWARMLAARGFEVLRFDYRGNGESSGNFEDMTPARWREDVEFCAGRLAAATNGAALVLQGVRFGALPAAELFASGVGDALLLWAPPVSAEALLRDSLRHNLIAQRAELPDKLPSGREQLIAELEAGELVNVDGYFLTRAMWEGAQGKTLVLPSPSETRPWRALKARAGAVPEASRPLGHETVEGMSFWNDSSTLVVPHGAGFFEASLRWLDENGPRRGGSA
jgi:pimeloyl-ACP methyl ester carboxylesterase